MHYSTLEHVPISLITEAFNNSFQNYFVPLQIDEAGLRHKIHTERIDLGISAGAFVDDKPVGFILNGIDTINGITTIYNGGTGVTPEHRGKQVTQGMYTFILPLLRQRGAGKSVLEVICDNERAVKAYKQVGYNISRSLVAYKGNINARPLATDSEVRVIPHADWDILQSFGALKPTWQHDMATVKLAGDSNITLGIYKDDVLCGFVNFNPARMRIFQLAIAQPYRRQGLATKLFQYIAEHYPQPVSVINIDERATDCTGFFQSLGLPLFISQYEMELEIS